MSRNWSREELASLLQQNPGLRVAVEPLSRVADRQPPKVAGKPDIRREPSNGLHELMGAPSWRGPLQPEEHLSCAVASELRRLTSAGRLRAVWSRVPGEHPEGGRYAMAQQIKRTCMGHVPGVPDLFFAWGTGAGFIELKVEGAQGSLLAPSGKAGLRRGRRTYLRGRQRLFEAWAGQYGVHHAVARSVNEVVAVLKGWGVLDG